MKTCNKCKKTLPIEEFYRHPNTKDGHLNECKQCTKEYAAKKRRERAVPSRQKYARKYSKSDIQYIKENYGKINIDEIVQKLGRTKSGIRQLAKRMGLTTPNTKKMNVKKKKAKHEHSRAISSFFSIVANVCREHKKEASIKMIVEGTMDFIRSENGGAIKRCNIIHQTSQNELEERII